MEYGRERLQSYGNLEGFGPGATSGRRECERVRTYGRRFEGTEMECFRRQAREFLCEFGQVFDMAAGGFAVELFRCGLAGATEKTHRDLLVSRSRSHVNDHVGRPWR